MTDRRHPLDYPVWSALTNSDQRLAVVSGNARRYREDVAPFAAFDPDSDGSIADFAGLQHPFAVINSEIPVGWAKLRSLAGFQMVGPEAATAPDGEFVQLGEADIPDMLELTDLTRPGPFSVRTIELGGYIGVRREGRLLAMAGERLHPVGWAEISAVCTHPDVRGQGLAGRLLLEVAARIIARGDKPFLHVVAENTGAIRLYEALGFTIRTEVVIDVVAPPV